MRTARLGFLGALLCAVMTGAIAADGASLPREAPPDSAISGFDVGAVERELEDLGFRCTRASHAASLVARACAARDAIAAYRAFALTDAGGSARLVVASVSLSAYAPRETSARAARAFLGFIAAMGYGDAAPDRALDWTAEHVGRSTASTVVGDAIFRVDVSSGPLGYVLTIMPRAAVPLATAPAFPSPSRCDGARPRGARRWRRASRCIRRR